MNTTTRTHLDPSRKHDFVFLFDVRDGNPNGDPDAGGMPRTDPETGQGLVTDVAIKRKIRNMVSLLGEGQEGYDIYVEAGVSLNSQHERAYQALNLDTDKSKKRVSEPQARDWMCSTFFDVRMFGAVMTTGKKHAGRVQGPLQLSFSRSVDEVLPQTHGITRITQTREEDVAKGESTEMGTKNTLHYGLFRGHGHFSAPLARRTGVTEQDLEVFWRAMTLMFEHDRASSRGEMALRGLYVFTHADAFGTAPAHELLERVTVTALDSSAPARSFDAYKVQVSDNDLPEGVTLTRIIG
ncbi:type I-C CRISPR-associated protein Cas7/Csd2 [Nocardiopsis sp. HUAS JQ3]|jgi:CRISPR-associated protein Csd2|uniref:type I-C CRISPR-associated protein Cas7/Csd2 n=1 Tax=Nocardiopsis sp. HUAS JQ3 TaxID=3061629 RepID=UPI0023A9DB0E|nr:type I-C CRISPR-associated protein Cas7/Csd2 [Nocardiopsis sp. HUAS JQ3]WDZ92798.1 type I-C CRISPR-associated protein Cas7/Csd2 [Nocardiopsis sp. HUAS JQ3]